jgi:hypothetical protein
MELEKQPILLSSEPRVRRAMLIRRARKGRAYSVGHSFTLRLRRTNIRSVRKSAVHHAQTSLSPDLNFPPGFPPCLLPS